MFICWQATGDSILAISKVAEASTRCWGFSTIFSQPFLGAFVRLFFFTEFYFPSSSFFLFTLFQVFPYEEGFIFLPKFSLCLGDGG